MKFSTILTSCIFAGALSLAGVPQTSSDQVDPATNAIGAAQVTSGGQAALGVFTLGLSGTCPGPVTVTVSGANPGATIAVAWSTSTGTFTIPRGGCAGTVLGLSSPSLLAFMTADAGGNASLTGAAPGAACGAFVQVVDLSDCSTSTVETVPSPAALVFPSASSAVIGSLGFVDAEQCGYFWDSSRGDSVSETFAGAASITNYTLDVDLPSNGMTVGTTLSWDVLINGVVVDSFVVLDGQTSISLGASFPAIAGPNYTVTLQTTSIVAPGAGAHTMRYAGTGAHDLTLN